MKSKEIRVGGKYEAKVSGNLTVVRVDSVSDQLTYAGRATTVYRVTNLKTGRRTTFRSPSKFRREIVGRLARVNPATGEAVMAKQSEAAAIEAPQEQSVAVTADSPA